MDKFILILLIVMQMSERRTHCAPCISKFPSPEFSNEAGNNSKFNKMMESHVDGPYKNLIFNGREKSV